MDVKDIDEAIKHGYDIRNQLEDLRYDLEDRINESIDQVMTMLDKVMDSLYAARPLQKSGERE